MFPFWKGETEAIFLKLPGESLDEIHSQSPWPIDHYLQRRFRKRQSLKLYINEYLVDISAFFF